MINDNGLLRVVSPLFFVTINARQAIYTIGIVVYMACHRILL
jgi:hypothetical protein